ncbi:MAG: MFS transporter [Steroidobacteraceae bacterium]|jgi:MFS family permease|nr:MFS transporter [Steroidobacteraceae bacterium]
MSSTTRAGHAPFFHGWVIAIASGFGLACSIATVVAATFSIFVGPIREAFGWSASAPFWAPLAVTLTAALLSPTVGGFVDRYGARRVILASFVLEALVLASFYFLDGSLAGFYARYVALGALGLGTTHVAFARVIASWFDRRRGLALGVALAGVGLGGVALPLLCQALIDGFGWRLAYVGLAGLLLVVTLPAMALTIRDTPAQLGLAPDGEPPGADLEREAAVFASTGATFAEARRDWTFWLMLVTFFLVGLSLQAMMLHLVPLLRGRGVAPDAAAAAQSTIFAGLLVGRLVTGWLMDRFFAPRVALSFLVAPIVGIAMLALGADGTAAFVAAALIGVAAGAEVDVIAFLTSRYFGMKQYSRIYGTFYSLYSLGGGVGPILTATSVDATGGYAQSLWAHVAVLAIGAVLLSTFRRFPDLGLRAGH